MARYRYLQDRTQSNTMQIAAHQRNRYLLRPRDGMKVSNSSRLVRSGSPPYSLDRRFRTYDNLTVAVDAILSQLHFGVRSEPFEAAIDDLAKALGFSSERPDKEWKAGPDNLWALRAGEYLLIECKSEVETTRDAITRARPGR